MKLRKIIENQSRRDFLKKMGAAASMPYSGSGMLSAAMSPVAGIPPKLDIGKLGLLYSNLPDKVRSLVDYFTIQFCHIGDDGEIPEEYFKKYVTNGKVHYKIDFPYRSKPGEDPEPRYTITSETTDESGKPLPSFPVEAVLGRAVIADDGGYANHGHLMMNILTGGDQYPGRDTESEAFDLIAPNAVSDVIDHTISKYGIKNVVSAIKSINIDWVDFKAWSAALSNPTLSKFLDMTPEMVKTAEKTGVGLRKMVEKDMIYKDHAADWANHLQQRRDEKNKIEREKRIKEKEHSTWADNPLASPMHQSFESKLNHALRMII